MSASLQCNPTKPTIAIDIDDVISQSTESLRLEVNKRLNINLQPGHYAVPGTYIGYYDKVWESNGLTGRITLEDLSPQMVTDQSHMLVMEGSQEVLGKLSGAYRLVVLTARSVSWAPATKRWLNSHFSDIFEQVYFMEYRRDKQTKGQLCADLNIKWLIDDNVGHVCSALDSGVNGVLFGDYGWHRGVEIPDTITRCVGWDNVLEYFDGVR